MISHILSQSLSQAVQKLYPQIPTPGFEVFHPDNPLHGDYSSNIALVLGKQLHAHPYEIAETIKKELPTLEDVEKIEVVQPGFLNFYLRQTFFVNEMKYILSLKEGYGTSQEKISQTILFEFGQPNTHKIPHIGHLFSYCYGESCARLLEAMGNKVYRANYQGDIGLHVAKCLWAFRGNRQRDFSSLIDRVDYLQVSYQFGSIQYEESEQVKQEINELNNKLYSGEDPELMQLWQETRQWCIDYYKQFESEIGVHYDRYYYESELIHQAVDIVTSHPDVFEEDQGAYIFRGDEGLHTRVFMNRFGNPTYEAKDLALAEMKLKEFSFDISIVTTANEQSDYWRVVKYVIETLWSQYKGKLKHIGYGMINLMSGKMSSRTGNIVTAFDLVKAVKRQIRETVVQSRDYNEEVVDSIVNKVAIGAIKYSFLKSNALKDITFDLETSIASEGNSGPYLQYTYARCQSVLAKSLHNEEDMSVPNINSEELAVLRWIYRYPEVVKNAAHSYAPHMVANFLFELAQRYSYFYNQHSILQSEPDAKQFRLALTAAVAQVLKNGLDLLGIEVTEKI